MAFNIGQKRHRVTLANPTASADSDGGYTETWAQLLTTDVWASIEPVSTGSIERLFANVVEAKLSHLVGIRYYKTVSTKTRLTFGARYLYVRGIRNVDERNEQMWLACEEVVS